MKTRLIYWILILIYSLYCSAHILLEIPKGVKVVLPELSERYGYSTTEYKVTTEDGYIIRMYRMRLGNETTQPLPVLLIHGIVGSAEDYLRMGHDRSLAYLLANNSYDVWLGNLRGNIYTSHTTLCKDDYNFWNFSFEEHGKYDVPKMVEKVVEVTGAKGIQYIGYSMGTTSYYIACNERPDIMKSVATFTALSPVVHFGPTIKEMAKIFFLLDIPGLTRELKVSALLNNEALQQLFFTFFCSAKNEASDICYKFAFIVTGEDYRQVDWDKTLEIFMKFQPCTIKHIEHYLQIARSDSLAKFDYGRLGNMVQYGKPFPPKYGVTVNKAPTALFYGVNDVLAPPMSVNKLIKRLKEKDIEVIKKPLPYKSFNHLDFIYSKDIKSLLNNEVLKTLPILYNKTQFINKTN